MSMNLSNIGNQGVNQTNSGRNRNRYVGQELHLPVQQQMQTFKEEVAAEIGLQGYGQMDRGELTSRQNGYVGGNMTKKMVGYAEAAIAQQGAQVVVKSAPVTEVPQRILAMNREASQGRFPGLLAAPQHGFGDKNQIQ